MHAHRTKLTYAAIAAFAFSCTPDGDGPEESDPGTWADDPGDVASFTHEPLFVGHALPGNDDHPTPIGPLHEVTVDTPFGRQTVTAVEVNGRLLVEGDIVVGTVEEGVPRLGVTPTLGQRWTLPVPFVIDAAGADRIVDDTNIRDAIDLISERTPVRFRETGTPTDHLVFRDLGDGVPSSNIGRQGGEQVIDIPPGTSKGAVAHEILHALGAWHEQTRSDRGAHLLYREECTQTGRRGNFTIHTDSVNPTPYDFESIMHYSSVAFCTMDPTDIDGDGDLNECTPQPQPGGGFRPCLPLSATDPACPAGTCLDPNGDGTREFIVAQRSRMTRHDVNGTFAMYARGVGGHEDYDQVGKAVAAGDFDGDGYTDLAVGAPGEAPGTDPAAGVVFVYKGTAVGLLPWRWISQETAPVAADGTLGSALGVNEDGDRFGSALVAADFDGDGVDDLAVGAFTEDLAGGMDAGAVFVFRGFANLEEDSRHGLQPWVVLTQAGTSFDTDEAMDWFGVALAAGDIDGDGHVDLAVGASGEAPSTSPRSGAVYIFRGTGSTLSRWKRVLETDLSPLADAEEFGRALAAGDLNGDGRADLAVGAPGETRGGKAAAGALFLFHGHPTQPVAWTILDEAPLGTYVAGDRFASAVAVGDFDGDAKRDLAVGSPEMSGGRVFLFKGQGTAVAPAAWKKFGQAGLGADETGDRFGAALAVGDFDKNGAADLVVGAPGEGLPGASWTGYAFVFKGGFNPWLGLSQTGLDANETQDSLATSVAVGDFDGDGRLEAAAGASGETLHAHPSAGAVLTWERTPASGGTPDNLAPRQLLHQQSSSAYAIP